MAERSLVFPAAEFNRRAAALQETMAAEGLDALLFTTPADIFYLTGFLTRFWESPARPWFAILPHTGPPVVVIPSIGTELMRRTWVDDIRTWEAPNPPDDGVSLLVDAICDAVPERGQIGLPMGPETHLRMPLADHEQLLARLRPRRMADATDMVRRVREVKSEAEIDCIRAACSTADRAFARIQEIAGDGRSLAQVFRAFQITLLEEGADWVSYVAGGAGPEGYADVISPADETLLRSGDVLMLDSGAVRNGYFCDFDRNFAIGRASDAARRTHAALHAATEAALEMLRPGLRACDVHRAMSASLHAAGVTPCAGRFGHGLGLSLTEWPSLMRGDDTLLHERMVLTLEPAAEVVPGRMLVHEENLVLRADGPELLSRRAPADLPVVPA